MRGLSGKKEMDVLCHENFALQIMIMKFSFEVFVLTTSQGLVGRQFFRLIENKRVVLIRSGSLTVIFLQSIVWQSFFVT